MNVKSAVLLVFLLAALAVPFVSLPRAEAALITQTRTFTSQTYDGYAFAFGTSYSDVVTATTANTIVFSTDTFIVGQVFFSETGTYAVYRGYVYFDTSIIPDGATILNATLSLCVQADFSTTDFNVTVQNGQPTYPHTPLEAGDYYYLRYAGNGGSRNTSEISGSGYWNITLNSNGLSWINKAGVTKLCLRSSNDIDMLAPTDYECVGFYNAEAGLAYAPVLYVTYQVEGYRYDFYGPFNEQTGLKSGNITVWVYPVSGTPFNFTLDGNYTVELEQKPQCFRFNLTAWNYTRYYQPTDSYEAIYVFTPADPYFYYYVDFIDLIGAQNAFMESYVVVNGSAYTVERRPIIVGNLIPFVFTWGWEYGLRVTCSQGVFDFGHYTPLAEDTFTLTLTPFNLPSGYTVYGNISVSAVRINATQINVAYQDAVNRTLAVNVTVSRVGNRNTLITEYFNTYAGSTVSLNWNNAEPDKDYIVQISVSHSDYGALTWSFPCPRPPGSTNPWNFDWLGRWPVDSSQLVGFMLVMFVFACFSVKDAHIGLIVGVVFAALLTYIGWLALTWTTIAIALCLCVMYALSKRRRE